MMAFLLFQPRPKRIVPDRPRRRLADQVLLPPAARRADDRRRTRPRRHRAARHLQLPPDGPRLQILQADGAEYLEQAEKGIDALLVDAFDRTGFAPSLANREFFENAFAKLAGNGVLVINLAGEKETYAGLIGEAMHVFDDQVIVISVPDDGNHILYAFKERHFEPRWRWLHNYAKELRANYGLDFPAFVQKMERSTKLGLARREAIRGR